MLQTLTAPQQSVYEDRDQGFDPSRLLPIVRRRVFYFAIPFVLLLIIGFLVVAIQRPVYQAEGKILVESPEIPTTLVQPTVTAAATERIQVIQQRIMTRDNLLSIIKKFGLFPSQQKWMSGTQLLDLMRERAEIQLVDIDTAITPTGKDGKPAPPRPNSNKFPSAIAFTMSFEYENPELAMKVANEFLTLILNEDVRARTNRATETTQFLAREVKRLQGDLDSVNSQLAEARLELKRLLAASGQQGPEEEAEQLKTQRATLTAMKTDLIQKSSVYSEAHPAVKNLKKRIAALEKDIADAAKVDPTTDLTKTGATKGDAAKAGPASAQRSASDRVDPLTQRQTYLQQALDEASKKLTAARLGETMERDQQAEHLQVIEQPALPQKPIKPKKLKLFAISFALALLVGVGTVFTAEMLDKSIRGAQDLAGIVDSHLVVVVPYITTAGEIARRRRKFVLLWVCLAIALFAGLAAVYYVGIEIDFSWFDRSWLDTLTRLTK